MCGFDTVSVLFAWSEEREVPMVRVLESKKRTGALSDALVQTLSEPRNPLAA